MGISGEQGTGQQAVADTQRGRFCRDRGGDLLYDDLHKRGRNGGSCACSISELPGGQRAAGTVPVDADECSAVFPHRAVPAVRAGEMEAVRPRHGRAGVPFFGGN